MIEETVWVISTEGEQATVKPQPAATCGTCSGQSACGVSALAGFFGRRRREIKVSNPIGARPGEQVVVGLDESVLTVGSFAIYIVPLVFLLLFAVLGRWLGEQIYLGVSEPVSIVCGLFGLWLGLVVVKLSTFKPSHDGRFQAVILRRAQEMTVEFNAGRH
ncbi:MAG: SoxR reducing system RseC family protein [Gammaproteobacteria bacterium]|nr:SoxR reducing system RseC family protein [Gammaproteobacteria bacterium]